MAKKNSVKELKYVRVKLNQDRNFLNLGKQPVVGDEKKKANLWFSTKRYAQHADKSYPSERVVVRTVQVERAIQGDLLDVVEEDVNPFKAKKQGSESGDKQK